MKDSAIRSAFHKSVLKYAHEDKNTIVVDELGIKNGEIRADIAVLNGKLIGYEIKSEKDTLTRLTPQVIAYSEVFEKSYLIAADKHIVKASQIVPDSWGIYTIRKSENFNLEFCCEREATQSETRNSFSIAQLLWKSEASNILIELFDYKIKSNHTRQHLYNVLAETCTIHELSEIVLKYLKLREGWRTNHKQLL
ncbi:sce7726 family protein [Flavobacterium sp.]|uniref:sce7726 family protein n=1 Tax=Flavobacterium sp. TaxID=239 RepID=UPI0039E3EDDA